MKTIFARLCCALILILGLTACSQQSAAPSIAVVDLAAVQNNSTAVAAVAQHLDNMRGALMAEALEAEKAFKDNETDETRQAYLDAVDRFEQAVGAEEQRIFSALTESIDRILADYRAANNIQAILLKDTVLSFDPAMDITATVTAELDKVEFDLNLPEAGEAPEAPAESEQ